MKLSVIWIQNLARLAAIIFTWLQYLEILFYGSYTYNKFSFKVLSPLYNLLFCCLKIGLIILNSFLSQKLCVENQSGKFKVLPSELHHNSATLIQGGKKKTEHACIRGYTRNCLMQYCHAHQWHGVWI